MQSDLESNASSNRGTSRPARKSVAMDRNSSSSASGSAPPTPQPSSAMAAQGLAGDPLADQEYAAFGVEAEHAPLPPPPTDKSSIAMDSGALSTGGAATGARTTLRAAALTAPSGRAKRPKNVKFSPAKGKALARRAHGGRGPNGEDLGLPNNDFCDVCGGKGHFLCCDGGCLRSFHFACLEPPLEMDDVPDEAWFCKTCRAARHPPPKPPRGFFRELIYRVDCENPKTFSLTPEIKNLYKSVASGPNGEYMDTNEHRPPSKITGRAVGQEDRDGYRLKEKSGRAIVCYNCNETANIARQRRIISCDFCEQHWHLDCLDPPMTGMPPPTRKWMCPLHSDQIMPKKRVPKQQSVVNVTEPYSGNNGDIIIVPRHSSRPLDDDRYEEVTVNRVRYQVPEDTVILDFWGRLTGAFIGGVHAPPHKGKRAGSADSGSPLTSLGDASDADPPEFALLGYSPYSKRTIDPRRPIDTSALDGLAQLANSFYNDLAAAGVSSSRASGGDVAMADGTNKGKGREISHGAHNYNGDLHPSKRSRASMAPGPGGNMPLESLGAMPRSSSSTALAMPEIPPFKGKAPNAAPQHVEQKPSIAPIQSHKRTHSVSFSALPAEVSVKSKEDLKALMHVRKLLSAMDNGNGGAAGPADPSTKAALLGFMQGAAVVPKLDFMRPEALRQPWDLPWDSNGAPAQSSRSPSSSVASPAPTQAPAAASPSANPASQPAQAPAVPAQAPPSVAFTPVSSSQAVPPFVSQPPAPAP